MRNLGLVVLLLGSMSIPASAELIYTTVPGSDSDGPLTARVTINAVNGGLDIQITNLETGTVKRGQAVSALSLKLSGLAAPTALAEIVGEKVNSTAFTAGHAFPGTATLTHVDDHGSAKILDHWGLSIGSTDYLATAGTGSATGNPHYMILPSSGIAGPGNSLRQSNFDPYLIGPTDFFIRVPGVTKNTQLTLAEFSNLQVGFGSGPDKWLGTVGHLDLGPVSVPEPSNMALALTSIAGMLCYRRWSRRK